MLNDYKFQTVKIMWTGLIFFTSNIFSHNRNPAAVEIHIQIPAMSYLILREF